MLETYSHVIAIVSLEKHFLPFLFCRKELYLISHEKSNNKKKSKYFNNAYFILLVVSTEIWCHWYQFIFTCCCHVQGDNSLKKNKKLIDTDFNTERLKHWAKKIPQQSRIVKFVICYYFTAAIKHNIAHTVKFCWRNFINSSKKMSHTSKKHPDNSWNVLIEIY